MIPSNGVGAGGLPPLKCGATFDGQLDSPPARPHLNYVIFRPCLPVRVTKAPAGPHYVHEIKADGFRLIALREGTAVKLYSRGGTNWSRRYPLIAEALGHLRISSVSLDGEAVILDRNGRHDFDALWNHSRDDEARLLAFDIVELNGEDYRQKPLLVRKRRLARLLAKVRDGLEYVEHLTGDGATIFDHACRLGLEGIVSKHVAHPYRSGRSRSWRKVKNPVHPSIVRVREAFEAERRRSSTAGTMAGFSRSSIAMPLPLK